MKSQNFLAELTAKEKKLQTLINKSFLLRDLFLGLVIYCVAIRVLGFLSSNLLFNLVLSIIVALGSATGLRRRIYKDRLKNVQQKITKLSQKK